MKAEFFLKDIIIIFKHKINFIKIISFDIIYSLYQKYLNLILVKLLIYNVLHLKKVSKFY